MRLASRRGTVALAVATGAAGLALGGLAVAVLDAPSQLLSGHFAEDASTALMWTALGLLLVRRAPTSRFGFLFLALGGAAAVAVCSGAVGELRDGTISTAGAWLAGWLWVWPTLAPVTLVPALFPDLTWRRQLGPAGSALAGMTLMSAGLGTGPTVDLTPEVSVANPLASGVDGALFLSGSALVLVAAIVSIGGLVRRLLASEGIRRRQLAPVVAAELVTLPAVLVASALGPAGPLLQLVVAPLVPGAVTWVVLRRRLYDLELVVRRSLVFIALSGLVLGGYVLVVQAAANLLDRTAGLPESVLAAAAVALAFQPARGAFQRLVSRRLYGERDAPAATLERLARELRASCEPAEALAAAAGQLATALRLPWVEIACSSGPVTQAGNRPSWAGDDLVAELPLVHLGVSYGALRVAPRDPGEPLAERDLAILGQLSSPVAATAAAAAHLADLHRSRERIVVAREEERRRLRRDLHDGVGPMLAAVTTLADVARLRASRDPGALDDVLERLQACSGEAVGDLRRIVDGLRPAAVDELGLAGALRALGESFDATGISVEVDAPADPPSSAATELAAYRIAAEAVTNAVRHSGARQVAVTLRAAEASTVLVVRDDGRGLHQPRTDGVGLASMRERADEIGGQLRIDSDGAGTVVTAVLPRHTEPQP